jgi:hypothetical protein
VPYNFPRVTELQRKSELFHCSVGSRIINFEIARKKECIGLGGPTL